MTSPISPIVVLSGPIGGGKTSVGEALCERFEGVRLSTHDLLSRRIGGTPSREELQRVGRDLDDKTDGRWVTDDLSSDIYQLNDPRLIVIDSIRLLQQLRYLRDAFGIRILHVHITASDETLEARYKARARKRKDIQEGAWGAARSDPTEAQVGDLAHDADIFIETDRIGVDDAVVRIASRLGLLAKGYDRSVDVIVGGLFGSEGKGHIAFYLAPEYDLLIRVGGPNAGHKVYLSGGETYTHHHLPSGTLASTRSARLLIGPGAVLNVPNLLIEIGECDVDSDRLSIDPAALVIERSDIKAEEGTLKNSIGSTAQGVGRATARRVMRGALGEVHLARDIPELTPFLRPAVDVLEDAYRRGDRICLEGTQGSGLSLLHGQYPYVTSRDTTASGCLAETGIPPARVRRVVLVCRTLPIRVANPKGGTSGRLKYPLNWKTVEERAGFQRGAMRAERTSTTNRRRRVGEFEWDLLRKSAVLNGPTDVALTFADYIDRENQEARRFDQLTPRTIRFIEEVEAVANAPVSLVSVGFAERTVIDRRSW